MASFSLQATFPGVQRIIIVKIPSTTTCLLGSLHEKAWSAKMLVSGLWRDIIIEGRRAGDVRELSIWTVCVDHGRIM